MRNRAWIEAASVVAVLGLLVGVNLVAEQTLPTAQLDLTQGHLYTLSPGTRAVLRDLKEPVTLRLFYSPRLGTEVPIYGALADRVREMLRQYAALAHGKLRLEFLNPEPFSETEDRALAYGLQGVPLDQSGEQVYFGLAGTNLVDDQKSIAFLKPEREAFLEYDLTRLIHELANQARPVLGVLSTLPLQGASPAMLANNPDAAQPWQVMTQLRQSFTLRTITPDTQVIDPDVQILLVAQAQDLPPAALYAIDQFVMRGGRLMAMVDPQSEYEASHPDQAPPGGTGSDLRPLFDAWGVAFDPNRVVTDPSGAWQVRAKPDDRSSIVDYIAWFNVSAGLSHSDPATADLQQVGVASAGFLEKKPGATIEFSPLLRSGPRSGVIPVSEVRGDPDPAAILARFHPEGGSRVIAARVRGVLHSAFSGPPPLPPGMLRAANLPPYRAESAGPANLVLVADSDILADRFWVRNDDFFGQSEPVAFNDNGAFVVNLLGTLAGGDALIGLRGRRTAERPFTVVDDMQHQAEARFRQAQQALKAHLDETEKRLRDLQSGEGASAATVTAEQQDAIDAAERDILDTRRKLRLVQLDLRRDISWLETELQIFNIALVPGALSLVAIGLGIMRARRRGGTHA